MREKQHSMKYIQHEGERHVVIGNNSSICPCDRYRNKMLIYNEEREKLEG